MLTYRAKSRPLPKLNYRLINRLGYSRGLTLIEMLVTLILVAIISTVIMQGMGYIWSLQNRYNAVISTTDEQDMRLNWWRYSVTRLITQTRGNPGLFRGDSQQFEGQSLSALGEPEGEPSLIHWQIQTLSDRAYLVGNGFTVLQLPMASEFVYLDQNRKTHDHWPLETTPENQLPDTILIEHDKKIVWAASPLQPQVPEIPPGGILGNEVTP